MRGRPRQPTEDPLALALRGWRDSHGINVPQAAAVLGVPQRTLEKIEQGGGFRYPQLLLLALEKKLKKSELPH